MEFPEYVPKLTEECRRGFEMAVREIAVNPSICQLWTNERLQCYLVGACLKSGFDDTVSLRCALMAWAGGNVDQEVHFPRISSLGNNISFVPTETLMSLAIRARNLVLTKYLLSLGAAGT